MKSIVVGIGDCQVSKGAGESLVTYALGSCIAIAIYDPVTGVGGLLHYLLPDSKIDTEKATRNPFMFADTGIPALFHRAYAMGAEKSRLTVFVAGGAQVLSTELFQIGKRNQLAMKKILWRAGVLISHEETGGEHSRTIRMELDSGRIYMKLGGTQEQQIISKRVAHQKEGVHCA
jgi:chemotaxis protein CheD